jgi:hypothetical protein
MWKMLSKTLTVGIQSADENRGWGGFGDLLSLSISTEEPGQESSNSTTTARWCSWLCLLTHKQECPFYLATEEDEDEEPST